MLLTALTNLFSTLVLHRHFCISCLPPVPSDSPKIIPHCCFLCRRSTFLLTGPGTSMAVWGFETPIFSSGCHSCPRHLGLQLSTDCLDCALQIDRCFGFETAVEEAQRALLAAKVEASSARNGLGLVKLMGRQSGFIAMQASMASGVLRFQNVEKEAKNDEF